MMGMGMGVGFSSPPPWTPAALGAALAGWWEADAVTLNVSNVASVTDKSGGAHPLLAAGVAQPLFVASGASGVLRFNGTSHYMQTAAVAINQPHTYFVAAKWTGNPATGIALVDGRALENATLYRTAGDNNATLYAGSNLAPAVLIADATWGILDCQFNGASSKIGYNGGAQVTGNPGAGNPGGWTLGADGAAARFSPADVYGMIAMAGVPSEGDRQKVIGYLRAKAAAAGVVIP